MKPNKISKALDMASLLKKRFEQIGKLEKKLLKSAVSLIIILIALLVFGEYGESKVKLQKDISPIKITAKGVQYVDENGEVSDVNVNNDEKDEESDVSSNNNEHSEESNVNVNNDDNVETGAENLDGEGNKKSIVCDISGAVRNPGVFTLEADSRLNDLIELAGGLSEEADIDLINRARILYDGEKVYIPKIGEEGYSVPISASEPGNTEERGNTESGGIQNGKVNINTATSEELQTVKGIGPSTAEKIIAFREDYGPFGNIEELMNISGIGEKTFDKMKSQITV